ASLRRTSSWDSTIIQDIANALLDPCRIVRHTALDLLSIRPIYPIEILVPTIRLLRDAEERMRSAAAYFLSLVPPQFFQSATVTSELEQIIAESDPKIRSLGFRFLENIHSNLGGEVAIVHSLIGDQDSPLLPLLFQTHAQDPLDCTKRIASLVELLLHADS